MKIISPICLVGIVFLFAIKSANAMAVISLKNLSESEELSSPVLNYRLPNETYPEHYNIEITTDIHLGKRAFQGEVAIDIVVVSSTSRVVLHAGQIKIRKAYVVNSATGKMEELSFEYEEEREFLTLKRKNHKSFEAGTNWKLIITYNGKLRDDLRGFYTSKYVDENGHDRYIALTHFESTNARQAFPCYDEPAKRAKFTITINHSSDFTAISNMPVNANSSRDGKTVFLTTAPIPTYIVAFVVCDFEQSGLIFNGTRHRVYSRSSRKHDRQFSLTNGVLYMNYLTEYYGIDYMLPKLDHVAVAQLKSGGMENWGLATYPERNILYNKKTSSTQSQTAAAKNVAHEVAHQWFGDYVTIQWWNYMWLKESAATLFSYKAMENVFPEWNVWQGFHVTEYQTALVVDANANSRPMTADVRKPSEIAAIYDEISYYKSTSVLLMWQNALGEEVFRRALQNFLKNNQYSAASEDDLFFEMEKSVEVDNLKVPASISEMMKTWTHQGGYPILTVNRNYSDGSFTIKQEAFFNDETVKDSKVWHVPINFASASKIDFQDTKASHYLLSLRALRVNAQLSSDNWLILNKRSEYFYRVRYDEENYKLITQALIEHPFKIHSRNRAQLLDDAVHLSSSNRLSHEVVLHMLTYMRKEDQYAPWQAAYSVIFIYKNLMDFRNFKHFIVDLVSPIFNKLGVSEIPGEHHYDKYTRSTVIAIACKFGLKECLVETNKKLNAFITKNITIEPDLKSDIFARGLVQANDIEFDYFYQKFTESPDEAERSDSLSYLSFAQNKRHIKKFVSSSIDISNKLQPTERCGILEWVYQKGEKSLLACLEFLNDNWDAYGNLGEDGKCFKPLDSDIRGMATYVFKKRVEKALLALVAKVKHSKHVSNSLESDVKNKISENYRWLREHGNPILSWISRYYQGMV